ncbi:MAG: hypothetical protein QOI54_156 [Actinomycetota bacterium]|jgi:hypothetical protein|nr:hypothetical protein [Actinomycetota bacterium]
MAEPIRKLYAANGNVRGYRAVVDVGRDPATGKRRQVTSTHTTLNAARTWVAQTRTQVDKGTFVSRERTTLAEHLDSWLAGRTDVKPSTRANYRDALQVPIRALGAKGLQEVTKTDVDRMVAGMLDGSLRRVGRPGAAVVASGGAAHADGPVDGSGRRDG